MIVQGAETRDLVGALRPLAFGDSTNGPVQRPTVPSASATKCTRGFMAARRSGSDAKNLLPAPAHRRVILLEASPEEASRAFPRRPTGLRHPASATSLHRCRTGVRCLLTRGAFACQAHSTGGRGRHGPSTCIAARSDPTLGIHAHPDASRPGGPPLPHRPCAGVPSGTRGP